MLARFLARQLGNPSGLFGRWVLAPLWNRRNSSLNDAAFDRLDVQPDDRVLEVGFGGGYLIGRMACAVTEGFLAGVDASPAMVEFCERQHRALMESGRLDLRCARAESLPFPSDHFTKVCSVNSIFYWEDAPAALSEMRRVLRENGLLVMCFTCRKSLKDKEFTKHGLTLYEPDDVAAMMKTAGFSEIGTIQAADEHRDFACASGVK